MVPGPTWQDLSRLAEERPEWRRLAQTTSDMASAARAPATVNKYVGLAKQLETFARVHVRGDSVFPVEPAIVALWLTSLSEKGLAPSTLQGAASAVGWTHRAAGLADPTLDSVVRAVLEGSKRTNARPVEHKTPLMSGEVKALVMHLVGTGKLRDLRLAAMVCVGFGAWLRIAELVALRWTDVLVESDRVLVVVGKSKTDQHRLGSLHKIPALEGEAVCPRGVVGDYKTRFAAFLSPSQEGAVDQPMWPRMRGGGVESPDWSGEVSIDSARRAMHVACKAVGVDGEKVGWHSLRAGAATNAARNGVPPHLLQELGTWRSDAWKSYVHWDDDTLLQAARRGWQSPGTANGTTEIRGSATESPAMHAEQDDTAMQGSMEEREEQHDEDTVFVSAEPPATTLGKSKRTSSKRRAKRRR